MRYVIYGAGGIGAGIGGQLALHGRSVHLIARGSHLEHLQRDGLCLRTPDGEHRLRLPCSPSPAEVGLREGDVVLLAMKSQDTAAALVDLRRAVDFDLPVVCAQNGVANERAASRLFDTVLGMLVWMPTSFLEPGVVSVHGAPKRGVLDTGLHPRGVDALVERLCGDLEAAGFSARPDPDVMRLKVGKLLLNLGNAVQALCGLEADARPLTKELGREGRACLEAAGIDFLAPRELLAHCDRGADVAPIEGDPRLGGSTWQSLVRGRGSIETDYLNGEIVLLGRLHGVPTPLNARVQALARAAALAKRPPGALSPADILEGAR